MYEEIKNNVRIGDVLRRYGFHTYDRLSYRIPCPIHRGNDANFSINERDGLWNCFSVCGRGGSVIDLVAALDNISISEAVKKLSKDFVWLPNTASISSATIFNNQLERYKKMKEDIKIELPPHTRLEPGFRGLNQETIKYWDLSRTETGVMIPLVSNGGKPCSYTIRRDDGNPKYENAKGTSKCWPFGLWQNKGNIMHDGFAYIVEGQLDAITMWQYRYPNVVAIMGSQISEQQAMLLLAVTSTLMLVMDGDVAGRKATDEIVKKWGEIFKIGHIDLEDGIDPDEYLIKGGRF